ncbi:hypothetical protein CQW23_29604 [Capsicum baccatum]|uniref:Saccharopine dehydrogenase NADP binding domain-containing protein n=1 Tax=Capsicum baccatum TaxID=33114 RepID=A0A2G2VD01_CAPBA|nr:hypothetical protein CQW23_29604 [Capsicum baccatum]
MLCFVLFVSNRVLVVQVIKGIPNAKAIQLDITNHESLSSCIAQVDVVISLLPPSCHGIIAKTCIELKKHLVTASYVDDSLLKLDQDAKSAGIAILGEMGLDPGIVNGIDDLGECGNNSTQGHEIDRFH